MNTKIILLLVFVTLLVSVGVAMASTESTGHIDTSLNSPTPTPTAVLTVNIPGSPGGAGALVAINTGTPASYTGPVTLNVGDQFAVSATQVLGYTSSLSGTCIGTAEAGQNYVCTISYSATSSGSGGSGGGGGGGGVGGTVAGATAGAADINGDGRVDVLDFNLLIVNWGGSPSNPNADLNGDGRVDILDFNMLMVAWR